MPYNILLTSLDTLENNGTLRYYSVRNEFGFDYCEALQSMEASTKYILARFPIDKILVIGDEESADGGKSLRLKEGSALYSGDSGALSAFDLYRSRIAQYIDELSLEQQDCDVLLPEEDREKLIGFIRGFQEQYSEQETKRLNRLFDELARSRQLYDRFKDELFSALPEARKNYNLTMRWVKNYLYTQLKPTSKLEVLPVNENVCARYIPAGMLEKQEYWVNNVLDVGQDVADGKDGINLFVSLGNNSVADAHVVLNMLDILVSTPGSNIHLKKIYKVYESSGNLAGMIEDSTVYSRTTDLVAAAHAFLNYSKTDMLVDFWENSGEHDERISRLIYAARHVDIGISMCNIGEMQQGIELLRALFRDERSWAENSDYGLLFGILAGCIKADYSNLLESDENAGYIELIKWAYRHQLYQQVLTLIETFAPAQLVKTGIFYYCDDEARAKEITNQLALKRLELKPYEYYQMNDIDHYFVKTYDRDGVKENARNDRALAYATYRAQSINSQDPEKINGHTACNSIKTVQNVLYAYFHLGEVRNRISHAKNEEMTEVRLIVSESDLSSAMLMMKETIEFFIMSYEKALEEVRGKNPKIVFISGFDVRKAADRLRYEKKDK